LLKSEALARSLFDVLIFEVCCFMKEQLLCLLGILHELTIADQINPSIIKNWTKKTALGLTGRLDYILLTLKHTALAAGGIDETDIREGK
jgi:hypothetical protein